MPRPRIDLEKFRPEIQQRLLVAKQTHAEIAEWLKEEEITTTVRSLKRRCKEGGYSRRGMTSDDSVVTHVANEFHTTNHTDETIANDLKARGIHVSNRQVKAARLQKGCRRRAANADQIAEQRARTFTLVEVLLKEGTIRCWGRHLIQTKLRIHHHFQAREEDVRDVL
jgi:hypothetical protein